MSVIKSAATVSIFTLTSRIFGYIRDILIALFLGAGPVADAFFVAFRLPNFFRQISAEGAFNAAFVPLFSGKLATKNKKSAIDFANNVFSFMLTSLLIIIILIEITMPAIMALLAPGFLKDPELFNLAVDLARIAFPYLLFISLTSLLAGILNSLGKFAAPAATPILLNLSLIASLIFFSQQFTTPAHALVWGIAVAGVLQLCWLLYFTYKAELRLSVPVPRLTKPIKTLLKRMVPGIIGGSIMQLNIWINTIIATLIPSAVSYLYYADRLVQFPLALLGTSIGVALLPTLSKQQQKGQTKQAINTQNRAIETALLLSLPAAAALYTIAEPIISVLFERGAFTSKETIACAYALSAYALGLPAFVLIKIFTTSFFATGDTKTPVKIAVIGLIVNIILNLLLMIPLKHVGLALATTLSSWLTAMILYSTLKKRDLYKQDNELNNKLPKIILCATFMGICLWNLNIGFSEYTLHANFLIKAASLTILIFTGLTLYLLSLKALGTYSIKELKALVKH